MPPNSVFRVAAAMLAPAALSILQVRRGARRAAEAREREAVGRATARLVHHIRNPVQSILLHSDLLSGAAASDVALAEIASAITAEAERLAAMLGELSEYAAGAGATARLAAEQIPLHALLRTLANGSAANTPRLEVEGAEHAVVIGDPNELRRALQQLLANAREAVEDREDPRIVARLATRGRWVELVLRDNGVGIPPDRVERAFEAFVTWRPRALGLGLTVAREIVERHGGRITIESEPGTGTTARVLLPRAASAGPPNPALPSPER